jgi:hypothetical protein
MGLPKDIGSRAVKPLRRKPPPSAREVITGRDADAAPNLNDAQVAGVEALGAAANIETRRKLRAYEDRKAAEREALKAREDAIWQDYLERTGRA